MSRTAYVVAFDENGRFLMVWHPRRGGWEMPGGHVEDGETSAQAAARECTEESGYSVRIVDVRDIGYCDVCAGILGDRTSDSPEMRSRMFSTLPDKLSFDRSEYLDTVPWALERARASGELRRVWTGRACFSIGCFIQPA